MLEQVFERLDDFKAKAFLRVYSNLLQNVVLGFEASLGLDNISGNGSLH